MNTNLPDLSHVVLETNRLRLEPISERWAEEIFREFTADITRYMLASPAEEITETLVFIVAARKAMCDGTDLVPVILHRESGEFLGCCGLHKVHTSAPEFGIWLKKGAHGNKYGQEAIAALKEWGCANLTVSHFIYPVDRRNCASRKVALSLGGRVMHERDTCAPDGRCLEEYVYFMYP